MPQLTRQELYDLVWSMPMKEAATSVSMSHAGLWKNCHRHDIPMPPRGYWSKLAAGGPPGKVPLPARPNYPRIDLQGTTRKKPRAELLEGRSRAIAALRQPSSHPASAPRRHLCAKRTEDALNDARPNRYGALTASGVGVACVRVSIDAIPRALSIVDELSRLVERLGHSISSNTSPAQFSIDGTLIPFELSETFPRASPDDPVDPIELARREEFTRRFPAHVAMLADPWMYRPGGRLKLTLSQGRERDLRNRWEDGRISLEQQLDQVVAEAVAHATVRKARQQEIEQRRATAAEAQRRHLEVGADDETERKQRDLLKKLADLGDDAEHLARFVRHLRHISSAHRSERLSRFLTWAESYVDSLREACGPASIDERLSDAGL